MDLPSQVRMIMIMMMKMMLKMMMMYYDDNDDDDLPSQRLREPAVLSTGPENVSPDCALALPSGACISYQVRIMMMMMIFMIMTHL